MKHRNESDRGSAACLALGALGGVATMVLHPTDGLGALEAGAADRAHFAAAVHGLGIVSLFLQAVGGSGVLLRMGAESFSARLGMAALALGALFGSLAATVSALTAPWLLDLFQQADESGRAALHWDLAVLHTVVNACTQVFVVGAVVSQCSWTYGLVQVRAGRGLAGLGTVLSVVGVFGLVLGWWQPTVHSLAAFMLGYAVWLGALALWLSRRSGPDGSD